MIRVVIIIEIFSCKGIPMIFASGSSPNIVFIAYAVQVIAVGYLGDKPCMVQVFIACKYYPCNLDFCSSAEAVAAKFITLNPTVKILRTIYYFPYLRILSFIKHIHSFLIRSNHFFKISVISSLYPFQ